MRPFEDGWIDERSTETLPRHDGPIREPAILREEIERFRGRVLSKAYALERHLDAMIVWHLFRDRQDGMAAFFEDHILQEGGVGFGRKASLARKIAAHWAEDSDEAAMVGSAVGRAKDFRDRVAHWPVKLQPLRTPDGVTVDYRVHIVKGESVFVLGPQEQDAWLSAIEEADSLVRILIDRICEFSRSEGAGR
jgi:hypothetical protein